jgi:GNAT superfamily N-acetyltransferase
MTFEASLDRLVIRAVRDNDHSHWERLWTDYLTFYEAKLSAEIYRHTWQRVTAEAGDLRCLIASAGEARVGLVHFIHHQSAWTMTPVCYLQDLYVAESHRCHGVGRLLIEAVASAARAAGSSKLYWLTHESNAAARRLYDQVAHNSGFIRYNFTL